MLAQINLRSRISPMYLITYTGTGSQDAQGIAVKLNLEKERPETTWICSGWLEVVCGMTADDVAEKAKVYFSLISNRSKNMFPLVIHRLMVAIANAVEGKVIYAKLLPHITGLYCDGRATFSVLKFVHDVDVIILQILKDTGRGWGNPAGRGRQRSTCTDVAPVVRPADEQASKSIRYDDVNAALFFDSDTRPRLLMIPWPPKWSFRTPAVATTRSLTILRRPRQLEQLDETVFPLVKAPDRCIQKKRTMAAVATTSRRSSSDASDVTLNSAIVLASMSVYWVMTLYISTIETYKELLL
ncbi:hypothetical protein ACI65C_009650 [Semiaphis heraclei]